jgi:hypothetical protein
MDPVLPNFSAVAVETNYTEYGVDLSVYCAKSTSKIQAVQSELRF